MLPRVIGQGSDEPDSWTRELPQGPQAKRGQSMVWTGAELIVWGGTIASPPSSGLWTNAGFSYDPVRDVWRPIRLDDTTPEPRAFHSAVWTGSEMSPDCWIPLMRAAGHPSFSDSLGEWRTTAR